MPGERGEDMDTISINQKSLMFENDSFKRAVVYRHISLVTYDKKANVTMIFEALGDDAIITLDGDRVIEIINAMEGIENGTKVEPYKIDTY